jgi:endo-1,4-beta-mannosidase
LATANLAVSSSFVQAMGTNLVVNGEPWRFVGYDMYRIVNAFGGHTCGLELTDPQVDAALERMRAVSGARALRTWFFQAYAGPGNWTEFDRVITKAAAHGIKLIPTLVNQWGDCEPWPADTPHTRTLSWYTTGYKRTDDGYPTSFRDYAVAVAAHYANNPVIAFWQLVNEAQATSFDGSCNEQAAASALRGFADDMTGAIRAVDPNHLVSLGTSGAGQCGTEGGDYSFVHAGAVDLCELHDYYPPHPVLPGDDRNGAQRRIADCAALGKPLFVGEAGFAANSQPDGSSAGPVTLTTLAQRASNFETRAFEYFHAGASGVLVWQYSEGGNGGDMTVVTPGDPLEARMLEVSASLIGWRQR